MGNSLVIPRAARLSTMSGEIPSRATSSPSSPAATPGPGASHDAGVALNPSALAEQWNTRLGAGAWHGASWRGGAVGRERSAARRVRRQAAAGEEEEQTRARRSREIIAGQD
jgi:hypothetical protein